MDLNNTYRVELIDPKGNIFIQYIDAEGYGMDAAIAKAKRTFNANLHQLGKSGGSASQKACDKTKLRGRLCFGFAGGHITLDVTGKTIHEALAEAEQHRWIKGEGKKVIEITSPLFYREEYPNKKQAA